jgi:hypothetical protein
MAQSISGHAAKRKLHVPVHKQILVLPLVRHLRETFQLVISKVQKLNYHIIHFQQQYKKDS